MCDAHNPEFAWSYSRGRLFERCPRAYYYHYHGAHRGWERGAPERARLLYYLKTRETLQSWLGKTVHRAIAEHLDCGTPLPDLVARTRGRMRAQFRQSRAAGDDRRAAGDFGLLEHARGAPPDDRAVWAAWRTVELCLHAFAETAFRDQVVEARAAGRRVHVEAHAGRPDFDAMKVHAHGAGDFPIYAAADFAIETAPNRCTIIDWKAGIAAPRTDDRRVSRQVALYALWLRERWSIDPGAGTTVEAYTMHLPARAVAGGGVFADDIDEAIAHVRASVAAIRACLRDPAANRAEEEDFPAAADPGRCALCAFATACPAGSALLEGAR